MGRSHVRLRLDVRYLEYRVLQWAQALTTQRWVDDDVPCISPTHFTCTSYAVESLVGYGDLAKSDGFLPNHGSDIYSAWCGGYQGPSVHDAKESSATEPSK